MRRIFLWLFTGLLSSGLIFSAAAQDSVTQTQIDTAKQKYLIAQMSHLAAEKCNFLNKIGARAAYHAKQEYWDFLIAQNEQAYTGDINTKSVSLFSNTSCTKLKSDPQLQHILQNGSVLISEYLYAISLSGVQTCGSLDQAKIASVMVQANQVAESIAERPDYDYVKPIAEKRGQRLVEMCNNDVVSDALFLMQTDVGSVFVEAVQAALPAS